jgi:DNA-binding NarL/FixJ family response regulator
LNLDNMNINIKVAIVEDDDVIRKGLEYIITHSAGYECVAAYNSAEDAIKYLKLNEVDVVLMDINLPGMSGIECVKNFKSRQKDINVMMLTVYDSNENIFGSLAAGASGYVLKNVPTQELLRSIKEVHEGGAPMSNEIARKVIQVFQDKPQKEEEELTKREYEIVSQLAKGLTYEEIADKLFISVETVRFHIKNIYNKLHVHSRTEATLKVFNFGFKKTQEN